MSLFTSRDRHDIEEAIKHLRRTEGETVTDQRFIIDARQSLKELLDRHCETDHVVD